ncbi:hypothetical protein Rsub_05309 [Raphidocelis subcapitata]|uniref:Aminoglycoside phosphotransferase domain-containing protein n=1 Tax=Raphidocelis subcapitata TaxID=307507 RepID=A0A2V0P4W1_9CHLO|nr:hypothetical protein Rsub_05309 [Raphidocelis subcapitata]|eukprot:GBF92227.1 hypothetical protein Rsub_05309 [Raphidocelis subcapitata]
MPFTVERSASSADEFARLSSFAAFSASLSGAAPPPDLARRASELGSFSLAARLSSSAGGAPSPRPDAAAALAALAGEALVRERCLDAPEFAAALGAASPDDISVAPLSGGLTNSVYLVTGPRSKLVVKHGGSFHRVANDIPFTLARMETEAACLRVAHAAAPDAVPLFVHHDKEHNLLATEFLEGRETLADALARGRVARGMGPALGAALARLAGASTPAALGPAAFASLAATLDASASLAGFMFDYVFVHPFERSTTHNSWPAALGGEVERLVFSDEKLRAELASLIETRAAPAAEQTVVSHTDIWLCNVLLAQDDAPCIIDFEFGCLAPAAFDLGHLVAQMAFGAFLARALADSEAAAPARGGASEAAGAKAEAKPPAVAAATRRDQEGWMLEAMEEVWSGYEAERAAAVADPEARARAPPAPPVEDVLGFAGVVLVRWSISRFNIFACLGVDPATPAFEAAVGRAVALGAALLRERRSIAGAAGAAALARALLGGEGGGAGAGGARAA